MEESRIAAISAFFNAASALRDIGVIRSDKYLGDIAEYICQHFYNIELAVSGRQPGYDGINHSGRVQVKYHGSLTRTNIDLGNPDEYDTLLVVLGPNSLLRQSKYTDDFLIYQMSSETARNHFNTKSGTWSCGKRFFRNPPHRTLSLSQLP